MIVTVVLCSVIFLGLGYFFYGNWLGRKVELDPQKPTPAQTMADGKDFVPASPFLLLGQHFSAIAAAGPIVGPILAGLWFGWVPALLWILLGSVFVGGPHDFLSLVASIRHKASSIGTLAKMYLSKRIERLFLIFIWFTLIYVIIAFTDITAQSFKAVSGDMVFGPAVVFSSLLYLVLGLVLGVILRFTKMPLALATLLFLPLVFLVIWGGTKLPPSVTEALLRIPIKGWEIGLLFYCFIASIIPVWLLLQPRGYLGGWFLYCTMAVALLGAILGGFSVQYPAFHLEGFRSALNGRLVFPILFITVACGACSGFHAVVSAGTTSKQLRNECDAKPVGYGAMILEGVVAVLALATVMMLPPSDVTLKSDPNVVYASGLARYMGLIGIHPGFALSFALLAFSTFVYDTLDVATRLARYILQELLGWEVTQKRALATLATLVIPLAFLLLAREKAYLVAWPIFGSSNQLMAGLTLLLISVWLLRSGKNFLPAFLPMLFVTVFTVWSLFLQVLPIFKFMFSTSRIPLRPDAWISGICGAILLILALWMMGEAFTLIRSARTKNEISKL